MLLFYKQSNNAKFLTKNLNLIHKRYAKQGMDELKHRLSVSDGPKVVSNFKKVAHYLGFSSGSLLDYKLVPSGWRYIPLSLQKESSVPSAPRTSFFEFLYSSSPRLSTTEQEDPVSSHSTLSPISSYPYISSPSFGSPPFSGSSSFGSPPSSSSSSGSGIRGMATRAFGARYHVYSIKLTKDGLNELHKDSVDLTSNTQVHSAAFLRIYRLSTIKKIVHNFIVSIHTSTNEVRVHAILTGSKGFSYFDHTKNAMVTITSEVVDITEYLDSSRSLPQYGVFKEETILPYKLWSNSKYCDFKEQKLLTKAFYRKKLGSIVDTIDNDISSI